MDSPAVGLIRIVPDIRYDPIRMWGLLPFPLDPLEKSRLPLPFPMTSNTEALVRGLHMAIPEDAGGRLAIANKAATAHERFISCDVFQVWVMLPAFPLTGWASYSNIVYIV